jgi:hypothetical protein
MQDVNLTHADGRTAVASTPSELVTLKAMGFAPDAPVEESPSAEWSHDRLDAYAVAHNIDFAGARTKADKVAAIEAGHTVADSDNA